MNAPTSEAIFNLINNMPTTGNGSFDDAEEDFIRVLCEPDKNPYGISDTDPISRVAFDDFREGKKAWNVLGLVNITEALALPFWRETEAALWMLGLCLPQSIRHNASLGPCIFNKQQKRIFIKRMEEFLRENPDRELPPREWVKKAKAKGLGIFAALAMIDNPDFRQLWEAVSERPTNTEKAPDRAVDQQELSQRAAAKRKEHDIDSERGARKQILDYWGKVEALHHLEANARQVMSIIKRNLPVDETLLTKKSYQNALPALRNEGLVPKKVPKTCLNVS